MATTPKQVPEGYEKVKESVCRGCGANYSQGSTAKRLHTRCGDAGWSTRTVILPKREMKVWYAAGYGPEAK